MGYAARSIAIEIELPETLAAEARAQGLLEPTALEDLFGEAIRHRHVEHLLAATERLAALPGEPLRDQCAAMSDLTTEGGDALACAAAFWDREVEEMLADPEAIPFTAALRRELLAGGHHELTPDSLAVPPGWQPRRAM